MCDDVMSSDLTVFFSFCGEPIFPEQISGYNLIGVGKTAVRNQVNSYSNSEDKKKWSYPQTKGSKALFDDELLAEILTTLDKKQWLRNCETPAQFIEQIRDHVNLKNKIAGKPELDPDWMPSQSWMNTVMAECNMTKNKAQVANAARKDATESVRNFLSNYCALKAALDPKFTEDCKIVSPQLCWNFDAVTPKSSGTEKVAIVAKGGRKHKKNTGTQK